MKKCPNCERTFDDNMRFCQTDGTPLVDDAPAVDPYKTMVASSDEIAAALSSTEVPKPDDEVLQLPPEADPKKTMFVSEEELRKEMAVEEPVVDLPPLAPEPPKFSEPSVSPPSFTNIGAPPASPFSPSDNEPISSPAGDPAFSKTTPPIPSPFGDPKPSTFEPPPSPNFSAVSEPEPVSGSLPAPFDPPAVSGSASAVNQDWESKEPMQNAPMGPAGQNKTLAIISLVTGILSLFCCGWFIPGIAAIVMGFMAKGKATSDPGTYGGRGLALGGIITGAVSLVLGVIVLALYFLGFLAGVINPNNF